MKWCGWFQRKPWVEGGQASHINEMIDFLIFVGDEPYVKRSIVRLLQNYANVTTNDIDNAIVDDIEKRLFPKEKRERDILIHF